MSNPPNPWLTQHVELLGEPPAAELRIFEETAHSIVSENNSPDLPFRFSVNPYRGCFHACAYCYARPTHQYLGFGAGTDFDRLLVVKTNAPELLRKRLRSRTWTGERLVFSGVTDCYQPLEASYGLTRRCLEVCLEFKNPVGIVTKGALVRRDAALLAELARVTSVHVMLSVPFADDAHARLIEPSASPPSQRLETMRLLAEAGVPVGVLVAPIIPGLNDDQIPTILRRAQQAGARRAAHTLLRLPDEVAPVFEERLRQAFPLRAEHVLAAWRDARGQASDKGRLGDEKRFGRRFTGTGPRWAVIAALFATECRRLGLAVGGAVADDDSLGPQPRARAGPRTMPHAATDGQGLLF
ncbi:MAG: radical SAM protein [Planctomycetota bacterium]